MFRKKQPQVCTGQAGLGALSASLARDRKQRPDSRSGFPQECKECLSFSSVSHFRAMSCLSNQLLVRLQVGCSRTGGKPSTQEMDAGDSLTYRACSPRSHSLPPHCTSVHLWSALLAYSTTHPFTGPIPFWSECILRQTFPAPTLSSWPWL